MQLMSIRRQEEERAPTLLNQLLHTGPMMRGEIVEHDHLPWGQGWTQHFADVPLENSAVYGTLNNERRKRTARLECTNQRLIFAPVAWSLPCCPLMTWRSAIQTSERGVKAAFVQKNQFCWCRKHSGNIALELRSQFLIPLAGDQRFFYG